ncbi:MAG: hypothetical protein KDG55_02710 [Rhodocyclaceae bacterium]|nr:hypothetical protein [Rhodocyclaceae bacterium]
MTDEIQLDASSSLGGKPTSSLLENPTFPTWRPEISLRRIRRLNTFEVQERDIEALDRSMQSENQALGFASASIGALISTILSWVGASNLTATSYAIYVSATIVLAISSLNFTVTWIREKQARRSLIETIKSQATLVQEDTYRKS